MLHALLGVAVLVTVVLDVLLLMYMRRYDRLTLIQRTLMPACRSRCVAQESVFRVQKNEFAQFSSVMGRNLTACHRRLGADPSLSAPAGSRGSKPWEQGGSRLAPTPPANGRQLHRMAEMADRATCIIAAHGLFLSLDSGI